MGSAPPGGMPPGLEQLIPMLLMLLQKGGGASGPGAAPGPPQGAGPGGMATVPPAMNAGAAPGGIPPQLAQLLQNPQIMQILQQLMAGGKPGAPAAGSYAPPALNPAVSSRLAGMGGK